MVLATETTTAAEVGRAALVQPHHDIDATALPLGDRPVRAEEPIGQGDVARLERATTWRSKANSLVCLPW
jgi:hypothetical protein